MLLTARFTYGSATVVKFCNECQFRRNTLIFLDSLEDAWRRVGGMLSKVLTNFLSAESRGVLMIASKAGLVYHAGQVLRIVSRFLGFPTDDAKGADAAIGLVCRGANVEAMFSMRQLLI